MPSSPKKLHPARNSAISRADVLARNTILAPETRPVIRKLSPQRQASIIPPPSGEGPYRAIYFL
jgi:hypothetical protein